MDLKLHWTERTSVRMRHDSQVAEDENYLNVLRSLVICQALFFGTLSFCSFDKGKPVEKRGRKAMGLNLAKRTGSNIRYRRAMTRQPGYRKRIRKFAGSVWAPLSKRRNQWCSKIKPSELPLNASLLLVVLISVFFNPTAAGALGIDHAALPNFSDFSKTVQNGDASVLRGVYVPDVHGIADRPTACWQCRVCFH